jgi:hypothetical protein
MDFTADVFLYILFYVLDFKSSTHEGVANCKGTILYSEWKREKEEIFWGLWCHALQARHIDLIRGREYTSTFSWSLPTLSLLCYHDKMNLIEERIFDVQTQLLGIACPLQVGLHAQRCHIYLYYTSYSFVGWWPPSLCLSLSISFSLTVMCSSFVYTYKCVCTEKVEKRWHHLYSLSAI